MKQTLLLVGNPDPTHIGSHLRCGAEALGIEMEMCDLTEAYDGPLWRNRINWWVLGRRPTRLRDFSAKVLEKCRAMRPTFLLTTGIAPIEEEALKEIGKLEILRLNYLTDDPWNPAHRAPWFLRAAPQYDYVFSPRRANLGDLRRLGCMSACYLPFAYAPESHFPEKPTDGEYARLQSDIIFAGGADRDRVPYMQPLIQAGFNVALYGGYWDRYPQTSPAARGHADPCTLRKAVGAAKVALCLVRRSNRDGNVMRTFELAAMGACMLTEDTSDHRELFGPEGHTAVYFGSKEEMAEKLRWLLDHKAERQEMSEAVRRLITQRRHTYQDRLQTMLEAASSEASRA
jgi:spore maturation protein CgeB